MFLFLKKPIPDWSFQIDAINALIKDFRSDIKGRFLLVLPTGGGKTLTAIRTLNELLNKGMVLEGEKVLWIVHTLSLKTHACDNLTKDKNYSRFRLNPLLKKMVDVKMKAEAVQALRSGANYKLIVIDEAHHAAAETYSEFFDYPIGILGLTATPRRMDARSLPFEKVSYSITFRELVRRKVVLLPKFLPEVRTNIQVDISSLDDENQLEKFNSRERNQLIAHTLFEEARKHGFKKVIVFAGTNAHVKRLYDAIKSDNELAGKPFEHIGFIYGGNNNDRGVSNEEYLKWHHSQKSSVLINCKILNEGYDDPCIDTVVMATPTNSILYYLQCIGRVVRTPEDHANARAHVVEIVDRLPNVSYRIDNRWLFAEISDYLEPMIKDIKGIWLVRTLKILMELLKRKAKLSDLSKKDLFGLITGKRMNFLLFNDVPERNVGTWRILTLGESEITKVQVFNDLSENVEIYYPLNHDYLLEQKYPSITTCHPFNNRIFRASFMGALHRAEVFKKEKKKTDSLYYLSVN